ncbi:MAG: ABC transporter permease, partial [Planctomycetes bacterium]|nr:ABC transporter permease [Planctomycetota bacterium]
ALPASLRGYTPAAMLVHPRVRLVEGSLPRAGHNEAMVGVLAAARMGLAANDLRVGRTFYLDGRDCRVTGIFEAAGTVMESEIWMPLNDLLVLARRDTISTVIVALDSATFDDLDLLAKQRLDLELVAMREQDYYAGLSSFYRPIQAVAVITAGLIALCGLCGGLNALYAAFVTRVRELASLQTLGFSRRAIVLSLVQESTLATCAGGLLACMAGAWLLDGLAVRFSLGAFGLKIDSAVLALGLLSGLLLGVVGALPPAWRCLRTPIATALKTS